MEAQLLKEYISSNWRSLAEEFTKKEAKFIKFCKEDYEIQDDKPTNTQ